MHDSIKWTDDFLYRTFRHEHLAYVPVLKCGSSSYTEIFRNILKWDEVLLTGKELDDLTVFAFIRNPIERYFSGLMTYILIHDLEDYLDDPKLNHMLSTFGIVFDQHTSPYSFCVPDVINVEWLLLNHDAQPHMGNFLLAKFLHHHNIEFDLDQINEMPYRFQTSRLPQYKALRDKVKARFNETPAQFEVKTNRLFYYDQYVYNLVNENTMYWKKSWPEISWLNNYRQSEA